jgi:hypothetical protein
MTPRSRVMSSGVNLLGRARGSALEDHVFDEVGDAVLGDGLVARTGVHPDAHGDAADVGDALGENQQAVRKDGAADIAGSGCSGSGRGKGCGHILAIVSQCHRGQNTSSSAWGCGYHFDSVATAVYD